MNLSDEQIIQFHLKGFFTIDDVFTDEEVKRLSQGFDDLLRISEKKKESFEKGSSHFVLNNGVIQRVVWACGIVKDFDDLSKDPRLTLPASQILHSKKIVQIISQCHYKLPNDGVNFPWHQDCENRKFGTKYWHDINGLGSYVQTVLAIDDMTMHNGPLKLVERSTRFDCIGLRKNISSGPYFEQKDIYTLTLKKGSLAIFHPFTIHGSEPNLSNAPRRIIINGYCHPGANHYLYPGCGTGRILET